MNQISCNQVPYIVLGSALAVFGGVITQVIMVKWNDRRILRNLKILLIDVIGQTEKILESIKSTHEKANIVYAEYLIQLRSSRITYDRNKEFIINIKDAELRKEIFEYFDKEAIFDLAVSVLNQMKNDNRYIQYADGKIKDEVNKIPEIKALGIRIKDKLKKI